MKNYIMNLLPRLKEFSESLDRQEIFIEKPWVLIDEGNNIQKYIFRRDGELIMSLNGQVKVGRWEYLKSAKSLLIDRVEDKILLNQSFVDAAVMILKKDNLVDPNLILANELIITDLDISRYLKELFYQKFQISNLELSNGSNLEVHNYFSPESYYQNKLVTIEGQSVDDGIYDTKGFDKIIIKNSKIHKFLINKEIMTKAGTLLIKHGEEGIFYGDEVFLNGNVAPDGKYTIGFLRTIKVKNGLTVW